MNIFQWIKSLFKKEQVPDTNKIVTMYLRGISQRAIAKEFGLTQPKVSLIINKSKMFADFKKKKETDEKRSRTRKRSR